MPSITTSINDWDEDEAGSSDSLSGESFLEAISPSPIIREFVSAAAHVASSNASNVDHASSQMAASDIVNPRAYQREMLDQSLKQNVIVVMDTGSGKTQVAVLRIKAELERCGHDKMIWFLAPTVSLCAQQFDVIRFQIASVNMKLITGNNNVHTWNARTWDLVLDDVRIVVSTYQVLFDALSHAFFSIDRLALVVFDEVHNCINKHPGSKVMKDFYHRHKSQGQPVPSILGLTATPTMRFKAETIERLECILDARCITPTLHREELLKCVNRPQVHHASFTPQLEPHDTPSLLALRNVYRNLDIHEDPYILKLKTDLTDKNRRSLLKAIEKGETYSRLQMKNLLSRASEVGRQLGPWAADFYLWTSITTFLDHLEKSNDFLDDWASDEKRYVANVLRKVVPQRPICHPPKEPYVSNKVSILLLELLAVPDPVVGIVFVRERAVVVVLCELLMLYPEIVKKYQIGCVVGASNYGSRRNSMYDLIGKNGQDQMTLQNFRSGKINLLVATAVLEEGIDVPACNLVLCFDTPATPKAFVQRRGRARKTDSRLIMFAENSSMTKTWEMLEREMRQVFEEEDRAVRKLELSEDSDFTSPVHFQVASTGARLDFDNAKQHLEHFCQVLAPGEFIDGRPDYILHKDLDGLQPRLRAKVLLPPSIPEELREFHGEFAWLSERSATKEVAFKAYVALYHAGLVDDNLLPFKFDDIPGVEARDAEVDIEPPLNPWHLVAREWQLSNDNFLYPLSYYDENGERTDYEVLLPIQLDSIRPIELFLAQGKTCRVQFGSMSHVTEDQAHMLPDHTSTLLALSFAHRWLVEDKTHVLRMTAKGLDISRHQIGSVQLDPSNDGLKLGQYLLRDRFGTPYLFRGTLPTRPPTEHVRHPFSEFELLREDVPYLVLAKLTKRSDFLHPLLGDPKTDTRKTTAESRRYPFFLPQQSVTVDMIPAKYAQFGMMIPCIIHELGVTLTAQQLSTTLLQRVGITDLMLVREAISARSAREPLDYERLEFLGDSILKYCATVQATSDHLNWPEGYLSRFRDRIVANSRLCRAALDVGLSKFILTRSFTGDKWRPLYLEDSLQQSSRSPNGAKLSTKTLADVVEALIGASYADGGIPKAIRCISTFIPECHWRNVEKSRDILFNMARDGDLLPSILEPVETLLGYSFRKKSLLFEAMTHASHVLGSRQRSYERLEFLGDAVLDNIIVTKLFAVKPPIPNFQMHLIKTAMVNGDFLAFLVMNHDMGQSDDVVANDGTVVGTETRLSLWNFMRHASPAIGLEQDETARRFEELRGDIQVAMEQGAHYPWASLARLRSKKFYSDLFESMLGAVWIDSGSQDECEAVVCRFGILSYLERIVRDKVEVRHPKESIGLWAGTQTVTYDMDLKEDPNGKKTYTCRVQVGNSVVAVDDGLSLLEATTKAAEEALKRLMKEKGVF
ncbi:Dicer-like protein 2 [Drechmeria coniospora]|uniref:Dicer-like protein 2 n=1 Tax=Drechmeria coniospora TaxID=98403 RepID=A0A151GMS1_DRECN|nr:Dicer-like protein 2 [Drechmeria coniospora]KYK58403.1 Dicer-like protein 2 [Drechmeria coniospora]